MKHFLLGLLLIILTACSSIAPTPTVTLIPTKQISSSPTETKTIEAQPTSSSAPSTTPASEPNSITSLDHIDVPDWLDDLDTTVAMLVTDVQGTEVQLSFLNLPTEEFFHIPISTEEVRGYFWMPDGTQFGLLLEGFREILLVDISNGNVTQQTIPEEAMRFIDTKPNHLLHNLHVNENALLTTSDIYFVRRVFYEYRSSVEASYDLLFEAEQLYEYEENPIALRNTQTGETLFQTDGEDNLYDISATWSPTANFLAVMQIPVEDLHEFAPIQRIMLLNHRGELINQFFGTFQSPIWSPDGTKILFAEQMTVTPRNKYPCILDVYTEEKICLEQIGKNHEPYGGIAFRWSSTGNHILYSAQTEASSELCIFNLENQTELCPTDKWEDRINTTNGIGGYSTSPNEEFIIFGFPDCAEYCHFYDKSEIGILSTNGNQFYTLGLETRLYEPLFFYPRGSLLWRPLIKP